MCENFNFLFGGYLPYREDIKSSQELFILKKIQFRLEIKQLVFQIQI